MKSEGVAPTRWQNIWGVLSFWFLRFLTRSTSRARVRLHRLQAWFDCKIVSQCFIGGPGLGYQASLYVRSGKNWTLTRKLEALNFAYYLCLMSHKLQHTREKLEEECHRESRTKDQHWEDTRNENPSGRWQPHSHWQRRHQLKEWTYALLYRKIPKCPKTFGHDCS